MGVRGRGRTRGARSGAAVATSQWSARIVTIVATVVVAACNPTPTHVSVRRFDVIAPGSIRRIAVMPFTEAALPPRSPVPGQEPIVEPPGETVTRAMYDALRQHPDIQVTDSLVVGEAFRQLYGEVRAPTPEEARAVGKLLGVDAVLRGQVSQFDERVGTEIGAEQPARVAFGVELLRMPTAAVSWQGEYAEQQQALSDNFWNIGGFFHTGARWVRARELATIGAREVAAKLHDALFGGGSA